MVFCARGATWGSRPADILYVTMTGPTFKTAQFQSLVSGDRVKLHDFVREKPETAAKPTFAFALQSAFTETARPDEQLQSQVIKPPKSSF